MLAWHFLPADQRIPRHTRNGVVSPHAGVLVKVGLTLRVAGEPVPERWGLHASVDPADAVFWAAGLICCQVRLGGQIVVGVGKVAAQERTVLWLGDATKAVWEWLCLCAERQLGLAERETGWRPERVCWQAIDARRLWLCDRVQGAREIEQVRGVARSALRRICANGADTAVKTCVNVCANLVIPRERAWCVAAARPRGWRATAEGQAESRLLRQMLARHAVPDSTPAHPA